MKNFYRLNLRFNLDNPEEREAVEFLSALSKKSSTSRNQFIVKAVLTALRKGTSFTLEDVQNVVRQELRSVTLSPAESSRKGSAPISEKQQKEFDRNILMDLEMF